MVPEQLGKQVQRHSKLEPGLAATKVPRYVPRRTGVERDNEVRQVPSLCPIPPTLLPTCPPAKLSWPGALKNSPVARSCASLPPALGLEDRGRLHHRGWPFLKRPDSLLADYGVLVGNLGKPRLSHLTGTGLSNFQGQGQLMTAVEPADATQRILATIYTLQNRDKSLV